MGWFDRELKLVSSDYFSMYNPYKNRWEIRKRKFSYLDFDHWSLRERARQSIFVSPCQTFEPVYDDFFKLQMGLYNARHARELLRMIDEENEALARSNDEEDRYQHRAAAKAIYHALREPTVHLSGRALPKDMQCRSQIKMSPVL